MLQKTHWWFFQDTFLASDKVTYWRTLNHYSQVFSNASFCIHLWYTAREHQSKNTDKWTLTENADWHTERRLNGTLEVNTFSDEDIVAHFQNDLFRSLYLEMLIWPKLRLCDGRRWIGLENSLVIEMKLSRGQKLRDYYRVAWITTSVSPHQQRKGG